MNPAALAIWNDVEPAHEAEFNHWYARQHLPERLAIPGFLDARRYKASSAGPKYFTIYELASLQTLTSPAYLQRLANPTEWTQRVMPWFLGMHRSCCRVLADLGGGVAGSLCRLGFAPQAGSADALAAYLADNWLPQYLQHPEICRVRLWRTDRSLVTTPTVEQGMRSEADQAADWIVVIEGSRVPIPTADALAKLINMGARPTEPPVTYNLMFARSNAPGG